MNEINQNDQIDQAADDQQAIDDMTTETRIRRNLEDHNEHGDNSAFLRWQAVLDSKAEAASNLVERRKDVERIGDRSL